MTNILILIADALRPDHLSCYGYSKKTSPNIDKLASEGVLFENAIAHGNHTLTGVTSILTGLYPTTHSLDSPQNYKNWDKLWEDKKTPLNFLSEKGFSVAGQDKWAYGRLGYDINVKNPVVFFREYKDFNFFLWFRLETTHLPYNPKSPYDTMFLPKDYKIDKDAEERINQVRTKSIIHKPGLISQVESGMKNVIEPPDEETRKKYPREVGIVTFLPEDKVYIDALYDGKVKTLDDIIGEYIEELKSVGIFDDTIIVFTSDHGEALLERGALGHSSCSLEGTLYDENIKIPLIIRYPKSIPIGKKIKKQVSQVDVMPTIFEILDLDLGLVFEGRSLFGLMNGKDLNWIEETYAETIPCGWQVTKGDVRRIWAVRTGDWKLIYYDFNENKAGRYYELFNLASDPWETINLLEGEKEKFNYLKERLDKWINTMVSFDVV